MDRDTYVETFRGSPLKRAKLEGLKRNAAVALGNRGRPEDVAALSVALESDDETVRGHAAWALGCIGGRDATAVLEEALERESAEGVR